MLGSHSIYFLHFLSFAVAVPTARSVLRVTLPVGVAVGILGVSGQYDDGTAYVSMVQLGAFTCPSFPLVGENILGGQSFHCHYCCSPVSITPPACRQSYAGHVWMERVSSFLLSYQKTVVYRVSSVNYPG